MDHNRGIPCIQLHVFTLDATCDERHFEYTSTFIMLGQIQMCISEPVNCNGMLEMRMRNEEMRGGGSQGKY